MRASLVLSGLKILLPTAYLAGAVTLALTTYRAEGSSPEAWSLLRRELDIRSPSRDLVVLPDAMRDKLPLLRGLMAVATDAIPVHQARAFTGLYLVGLDGPWPGLASLERDLAGARRFLVGPLRLAYISVPSPEAVVFAFREEVVLAKVSKAHQHRVERCKRWTKGRRHCSGQGWNNVGRDRIVMASIPRLCVWAHPLDKVATIVEYKDVPLGRLLRGHVGLADIAVKAIKDGSPVTLAMAIDGQPLAPVEAQNKLGFFPFQIPTPHRRGQRGDVRFEVTTPFAGVRHFCFDAEVVD